MMSLNNKQWEPAAKKSLLKSAGTGLVKSAGCMGCWAAKEHTDDPCMLAAASGYASDLMLIITSALGAAMPFPSLF